jgi:hypothetical protein
MAPKLSAQQIDSKLADIRDYVRADLRNLVARGAATLKAVFRQVNIEHHTEKAFYFFLWKYEERFSEAQQAYADETFALLAQYRQSSGFHTRAETGCRAASSNDPQRDRSRSVRRRTAVLLWSQSECRD